MEKDELREVINSMKKRCDVCLILLQIPETEHLLCTVLEDLHAGSQLIMDEHCTNKIERRKE